MLAAEGSLLLLLHRRVRLQRPFLAGRLGAVVPMPEAASAQLSAALTPDIYQSRRNVRALARRRLGVELGLFGKEWVPDAIVPAGSQPLDMLRAQRAARGYAQTWLKEATRLEGLAAEEVAFRAEARAAYKLSLSATTETAEAFGAEREIAAREKLFRPRLVTPAEWTEAEAAAYRGLWDRAGNLLPAEVERLAMLERKLEAERELVALERRQPREQWWKVWDASLDKRTCPKCESAHGKSVRVGEDFPEGEPGGIHPRCRCEPTFLPASWVDFGYND
jgi:hypothetical protein